MSTIVDQYGCPVSSDTRRFQRSASQNAQDRPWVPCKLDDIGKLIEPRERKTLVAVSRLLCENWAPARAIMRQIPMTAVGKAWKPSMETSDEKIKKSAETVIREQFSPIVDTKGRNLSTVLYLFAHMLLRDGEFFYLLTEQRGGWPMIQVIPSHRIGQRDKEKRVLKGLYEGLEIDDGVIFNRRGTPVAYRFLADDAKDDQDISARNLIHRYDSDYPESRRGYPSLSHALNDGRDGLQSHEWERLNMLARSSRTMIEWNETGAPDHNPASHFDSGDSGTVGCAATSEALTVKPLQGGTWTHFKAGSGSKLEAVTHETPGEVWESFNDRLVWKMCAGVPWPTSFVKGDYGRGGGTAERRDIMLARQTVDDMQSIIERDAKIIIGYAYKKLVKIGTIKDSQDWWRWSFAKPPKLTIDDGKASKSALEMWRSGHFSDSDILTELGKDHDEYYRDKFNRAADKEILFMDVQAKKGVTLDPRIKGMFNPQEINQESEKKDDNED